MRRLPFLLFGTVVMLLAFVFMVGGLGVGSAFAKMERTVGCENVDGDPKDGNDSDGGFVGGGGLFQPPAELTDAKIYEMPVFIGLFGFNSVFMFEESGIYWVSGNFEVVYSQGEDH